MTGSETSAATSVTVERRDDGVAVIHLDRPKMNFLSVEMLGRLEEAVGTLAKDLPGAVVVTGGRRVFSAGADITQFNDEGAGQRITAAFHSALGALAALPRPVIAAINGFALGGGCELALAADLRFAATGARLGQPEILLGVIPGGGGTQRLARLVGASRAKELIFTGRQLRADEALAIGLVDRVVKGDEVLSEAIALAAELARGPLTALALAKQAIDEGIQVPLAEGLALEQRAFIALADTEDAHRGVDSFLAQGPGKATFVGH